jgi:hypothetical protein
MRFQVVEHNNRAFVKPEVLDRVLDFAVFDVKRSVARQSGQQERLWIDGPDVPEFGHQNTALRGS